MSTDPAPTPQTTGQVLLDELKAIAAAMAPGWFQNYVVPGAALSSALWCAIATVMLLRGWSLPIPDPVPEPPPAAIAFVQAEYKVTPGDFADLEVQTAGTEVKWLWPDGLNHREQGKGAIVGSGKQGSYRVYAWTALKGSPTDAATCIVTVGQPAPPLPPVPPTPPSPIPNDGFRVLVVTKAGTVLPQGQLDALYGADVQTYLRSKCVKGVDGKTPEFRFFTDTTDVSKEAKLWQDFMKLPRPSLPWLFIANGDKGASQQLPADQASMLALLKSIGG